MPTTLTGLLLFVVLLLPGFAYLVGKERHGTERKASPFRETVAIIAASVSSEIFVLALLGVARWWWPSGTPDVGQLIRNPGSYLAGTEAMPAQYGKVGLWGLAILVAAMIVAYAATMPSVRRAASKLKLPLIAPYPHDSTVSGWWILFEKWKGGRPIEVGCVLDDGSYVSGSLASFNTSADDMPERDLILRAPILYRPPGAREPIPHEAARAVSITASRIVTLFVGYLEAPEITPSPAATLPPASVLPAVVLPAEEAAAEPRAAGQPLNAGRSSGPSPRPGESSCETAAPQRHPADRPGGSPCSPPR
jgi:Family of unknown function (DUF6338)